MPWFRAVRAPIQILPDDLASQIAAGEVVERPSSVVKELIENSLDAEATRIDVSIEGGGITSIEIADDGIGMTEKDAKICLGRHATSKLRAFTDLDDLRSYGFRGEALPSIASVSRLSIRTRGKETDGGVHLQAEGTCAPTVVPAGHPVGTTLRVSDLFFNVPARRKFLKSSNTESGHVGDAVVDAALSRPEVAFSLTRDGRRAKKFPRAANRRGRVEQVFPDEQLIQVKGERGPLALEGYLTGPERSRQGAGGLKLIVNGRPVKDRALAGTIAHAYAGALERGRFPKGALYLELPADLLDVNVHPQKTEVRFSDARAVADAIHSIVGKSMARAVVASQSSEEASEPSPSKAPVVSRAPKAQARALTRGPAPVSGRRYEPVPGTGTLQGGALAHSGGSLKSTRDGAAEAEARTPRPARRSGTGGAWMGLRFLNQVKKTYLLCEGAEALFIIDQHAADERVLHARLKEGFAGAGVANQALLFPSVLKLEQTSLEVLRKEESALNSLGFDVRERSGDTVSLHAVPRLIPRVSPEELLPEVLSALKRGGSSEALCSMACLGALKVGDTVLREEAEALLRSLNQVDFRAPCHHGHPIVDRIRFNELARKVPTSE